MRAVVAALSVMVAGALACSSTTGSNGPCSNIAGTWSVTGGSCSPGSTCMVTQSGCAATFVCSDGTQSSSGSATSDGFRFSGTTGGGQSLSCTGSVSGGSFSGNCSAGGQACTVDGTLTPSPGPAPTPSPSPTSPPSPPSPNAQPLGGPCTADGQCSSGICANGGSGTGWCTTRCTQNSDCPNAPYVMWCVRNSAGASTCFTACNSSRDCSGYGSGSYCQAATSIDGYQTSVCVQ